MCTLPGVKQIASGSSAWCSLMTERRDRGWSGREAEETGDVCILMADSCCSTAETNAIL